MEELDFSEIICGICNEVTTLSEEVQETLIEFLNNGEIGDEEDEENEEENDEENEVANEEDREDNEEENSVENDDVDTITNRMAKDTNRTTGGKLFTLASGISLLLFYAFAMQCMSTLAIVKRETNTWKWPMLQLVIMSAFAYLVALIAYQLLK